MLLSFFLRPVNDNRASLLRSSTTVKKPANERDYYIHVWKNYITFAFRVVPPVPSPIVRCASPDLSLRYVPISKLSFRFFLLGELSSLSGISGSLLTSVSMAASCIDCRGPVVAA